MRFSRIEVPTIYTKRRLSDRCCFKTVSTGTSPFNAQNNRCARIAVIDIDELKFCRQHAGYIALDVVLNEERSCEAKI